MKIFALETSINVLRKQYIVGKEDEKELLCTHFHWIKFFVGCYRELLLTAVFTGVYITLLILGVLPIVLGTTILFFWLMFTAWRVLNAFISYRYSYVIVTTEKVIQIMHNSLFSQMVNPMHLDAIISTDQASQFFGVFNFGIVVCNLTERTKYSSKQVIFDYLPSPNAIAGIIENAIVVQKHFRPMNEQLPKEAVETIQKKAHNIAESEPMNVYDTEIT